MKRRLAAIFVADLVGYSRLMAADEEGTLARLRAVRSELIDPTIAKHHGRIVKLMGDGALVEFASVVDAVRCAVDIQRGMAERELDRPEDQRIQFRIGVNLGDVMVEGDDIYGDGVNVAARLESLAEPGGIVISGTAFDHAKKAEAGFRYIGQQQVKNIPEPVRAYQVLLAPAAVGTVIGEKVRETSHWQRVAIAAAMVLIVAAAGVAGWLRPWERSSTQVASLDEPSIAVLPFENLSGDPEQEYFSDGVTEDLITDLSKLGGLFVIARNSTFVYKDKPVDVREVAEELGVRYVLEGSVRRAGDQIRINAQLIDATTGGHVWANRYDGAFGDVFGLQDRVVERIVSALAGNLPSAPSADLSSEQAAVPAAYDAFLRGWANYRHGTPDDFAVAVTHMQRAVALDPDYSRAHAALAAVYAAVVDKNWSTGTSMWSHRLGMKTDEIMELEEQHLAQAIEDPVALAHQVAATRLSRQGRHEEALDQAERALALGPSDPNSHRAMASALIYAGRPAQAAEEIAQAMRLDPHFPQEYLYWLGLAQFGMAHFEEAAASLERAAAGNLDDDRSLIVLAAAYGHLGRLEEAEAAMDRANDIRMARQRELGNGVRAGIDALLVGAYSLKDLELWPFAHDADRERLHEGLARAGVPETGADENVSPLEVAGATTVDAATAKSLFDRGVAFVDVRGKGSWADGHVPGAVHLDLKEDFSAASLAQVVRRDEEVVIYCMGPRCLLSSEACKQAVAWGFRNVYFFREGFPAWKASGYPVAVPDQSG